MQRYAMIELLLATIGMLAFIALALSLALWIWRKVRGKDRHNWTSEGRSHGGSR